MNGILMKPWKIKAIADSPLDREWQTRRVINFPQLPNIKDSDWHAPWFNENLGKWVFTARFGLATRGCQIKPRYQVGETVYIKEAWWFRVGSPNAVIFRDGTEKFETGEIIKNFANVDKLKFKSPMFLKAAFARYFIKIKDVRAERLQEITWEDTHKEGILRFDREHPDPENGGMGYNRGATRLPMRYESVAAYMDLWDSINKPPYDWASNPWVWVYSFKREG